LIRREPIDGNHGDHGGVQRGHWLLADQGPATRPAMANAAPPAPLFAGGHTDDAQRAEHGFSGLMRIAKDDRPTRVLSDVGQMPGGLVENMRRLDLSPRDVHIIVLSHGHWDYVTGMDGLGSPVAGQRDGRQARAGEPGLGHQLLVERRGAHAAGQQ
jgi:hypothetical protein